MPGELIPIVLFVIVPVIIKIVSDNSVRKMLIEKGMVDENIKYLYGSKFDRGVPGALKWGMVCTALGLAIYVGQIAAPDIRHEMTLAGMLIFGGLALILYYFIARRMTQED